MRRLVLNMLAGLVLAMGAPGGAALAAGQIIEAAAGKQIMITLKGNPSTGYGWHLRLGKGADKLLRIDGCGWQRKGAVRPGLVGAPGIYRCRITPLASGRARIEFRYLRPWEHDKPPLRVKVFEIRIR